MSKRLDGKTALITAAGQGIGRATAIRFATEGATVWATDIDAAALDTLRAECPAVRTCILDVRNSGAIDAIANEIDSLDVLFNCAGFVHQGSVIECTETDWNFSFDLNVSSMYRTCRAFLPGMLAVGNGCIINMSSIVSSLKGAPNRFAYGVTKGAVIGLTKAIAADFVSKGIRCNAICPGTIETPSLEERIASMGDAEKVRPIFVARQPIGRLGRPEEIASAALFLASDESEFMTGQTLVLDGGWSI